MISIKALFCIVSVTSVMYLRGTPRKEGITSVEFILLGRLELFPEYDRGLTGPPDFLYLSLLGMMVVLDVKLRRDAAVVFRMAGPRLAQTAQEVVEMT